MSDILEELLLVCVYFRGYAKRFLALCNSGLGLVNSGTGFCRIFATELEDRRPKTVPYLEEVVE